ncbi:MAG TPA: hypothetical protein VHD32_14680 [Candidatus Didemnitutus sp.]|nr:hypothetical protein [Candidatus Didemnitutus sp.]
MNSTLFKQLFVPGLLVLALVGPRAHADDSTADRPPTKTELKRYDADKDGKLDEEETAHMKADEKARKEAREKKILAKYDANKNGVLDPEEKAKWEADRKADHDRRVAQREARQAAKEAAATDADGAQK